MMIDNNRVALRAYFGLSAAYWRARGMGIDLGKPLPKIHQRVRIRNPRRIELGSRASLRPYSMYWAGGTDGTIRLGRRTGIGEFCVLNAVERIEIGDDCAFGPGCHITDANHEIEPGTPFLDQGRSTSPVVIGNDVWVASGVRILSGVTIGDSAVVAAGAVVNRDVPAGAIVGGVPARVLKWRDEALREREAVEPAN